jgi:hypothetical protein
MQLRLLTTQSERSVFLARLAQARTRHEASFRENTRLRSLNKKRLECSRLYGLFHNDNAPPSAMLAGVAMHDLRSFPQSCVEPNLSHLPPETVAECSDHWSLSNGAGIVAWAGLAVPMRLLGITTVLAYLAASDHECAHASFYRLMGFQALGPKVPHPFVETPDGEKLMVQPVILQGEAFDRAMKALSMACTHYSDDARVFELRNIGSLMRLASVRRRDFDTVANTVDPNDPVEAVP